LKISDSILIESFQCARDFPYNRAFRGFLWVFLSLFITAQHPAYAEKKIAAIRSSNSPIYNQAVDGFKRCLKAKNIAYDYKEIVLTEDSFTPVAALLKSYKPDVILTLGTFAAQLTKENVKDVPFIFCMVINPKQNNFRAGGVSLNVAPLDQLRFVKNNFPQMRKIGLFCNTAKDNETAEEFKSAARKEKMEIVLQEVATTDQINDALSALVKEKIDLFLMLPDTDLYAHNVANQFILQTLHSNIPVVSFSAPMSKAGAIAAIYADYDDNGCLAAAMAARVLAGTSPADIEIASPSQTKFTVNSVVTERLNIKVNDSTLDKAEQVLK